jgi:hypothetical protein
VFLGLCLRNLRTYGKQCLPRERGDDSTPFNRFTVQKRGRFFEVSSSRDALNRRKRREAVKSFSAEGGFWVSLFWGEPFGVEKKKEAKFVEKIKKAAKLEIWPWCGGCLSPKKFPQSRGLIRLQGGGVTDLLFAGQEHLCRG